MIKISNFLKKQMYIILIVFVLSFIAIVFLEYQIMNLDFPMIASKEIGKCENLEVSQKSAAQECVVTVYHRTIIPFLVPPALYIAILITGILYLMSQFKVIINQLVKFEENILIAIESNSPVDYQYKFLELNQIGASINDNIEDINQNEQLRSRYVNYVMHDIKTPLQIITGYLELLKLSGTQPYIEPIEQQVAQIDSIVQNNTFIEGYTPNIEQVNIEQQLLIIRDSYINLYPNLKFEIESNRPLEWSVDLVGFKRSIQNLISNGIAAQDQDPYIKLILTDNQLKIIDHGHGFSQEQFESYLNQKDLSREHYGLQITSTILKANNIVISFKQLETGTVITLTNLNNQIKNEN